MKSFVRRSSIAGLASVAAAFASSSCSLPPREAWHQIQQEGLIGFLANQCHAPASTAPVGPAPSPAGVVSSAAKTVIVSNSEQFVGPPGPAESPAKTKVPAIASSKTVKPAPAPAKTSAKIMPVPESPQMATAVPSLPGFVRTPYTTPPRLVDVKGAGPGATMVCPYTQRVFIIPPDFVNQPAVVAGATPATTTPQAQPPTIAQQKSAPVMPPSGTNPPAAASKNNAPGTTPPGTSPPAVASKNSPPSLPAPATNPPAVAPKNSAPATNPPAVASKNGTPSMPPPATNPPANALFSNKPANTPPSGTNTAAAKSAAPEIPYGIPIPNRPGFVNSPFAAKYQLVDVSGLPVGMEVKCPYTGKLFRVPAMDIAEQKAVAAPGSPPAPEKAEKK